MKANVPQYRWHSPRTLQETLTLLREKKGRPFAGGTDLMVLFEAGKLPEGDYVNIWQHTDLRQIDVQNTHIDIGSLCTYRDLRAHSLLQKEFPMLGEAAQVTGAIAIQNRGTLGGNIANASPAADSPPVLLCYDAQIEVQSVEGPRWIEYKDFHVDYKKMQLRSDELITKIRIPRREAGSAFRYQKVGTRRAQAISKVCFAAIIWKKGGKIQDIRIAVGSVAPIPKRCTLTEAALRNQALSEKRIAEACQTLSMEISPVDDIRSNRAYRLKITQNILRDFLEGSDVELA